MSRAIEVLIGVFFVNFQTLPELKAYSIVGRTTLTEAFKSPITIINFICFLFFSVEFVARFVCCPCKRAFIRRWSNWTDLMSILPYLIVMLLLAVHYDETNVMPVSVLNTLRACRLFLVTRVLGTSRYQSKHGNSQDNKSTAGRN